MRSFQTSRLFNKAQSRSNGQIKKRKSKIKNYKYFLPQSPAPVKKK